MHLSSRLVNSFCICWLAVAATQQHKPQKQNVHKASELDARSSTIWSSCISASLNPVAKCKSYGDRRNYGIVDHMEHSEHDHSHLEPPCIFVLTVFIYFTHSATYSVISTYC